MKKLNYEKPKVISEIGCNHMGKMEIAKELIKMSKDAGATVAKFQKRNNKLLLTEDQYSAPHPNPYNSYGDTYGAHREYLELSIDQHRELKEYAESIGIEWATSVWETISAREVISLNPVLIKVPSACNNNYEMLKILRDEYAWRGSYFFWNDYYKMKKKKVIEFFEETNQAKSRLIIYSCTSGYPVPFKDICLLEINRLYEKFENRVKEIGFSGHHLGIAADVAAYTLGSKWIERHFTKDRTWKGTDHAASLEYGGLKKLVRDLTPHV